MSSRPRRKREHSSSSDDFTSSKRRSKLSKVTPPWSDRFGHEPIKVYLVQAKLDVATIANLYSLIEAHGSPLSQPALQLSPTSSDADVIVTAIRMRQRLIRHVDWDVARHKHIVTPQWLKDCVKQREVVSFGPYAAMTLEETLTNQDTSQSTTQSPSLSVTSYLSPTSLPAPSESKLRHTARYSCARASPMVCPNQDLVGELEVLRRSRELEGLERNALSYERAIAAIKALPHRVTARNLSEVKQLSYIGEKMAAKIEEFHETGIISESGKSSLIEGARMNTYGATETTRQSARFQSLSKFAEIYGIGPKTARDLFDKGLRTIDDMEKYYDVPTDTYISSAQINEYTPNGRLIPPQYVPNLPIQVSLLLRKDFEIKIPREEVEAIRDVVMEHLNAIKPACVNTIVGGYRRGKVESNDVDIVFSHPNVRRNGPEVKGLCEKLVQRLHEQGLVTNVMHLSSFRPHDALRTANWDSLEKALTVFVLPPDHLMVKDKPRRHRRLDLIFATPEAYWTAVVGWTGSKMFERDLRTVAKEKGLKFDSSGLTRRRDSMLYHPKSEKEIFDILGLEWVDPIMRNADA